MNFDKEYQNWIISLKDKIRGAQIKAAHMVNGQLIFLYWDLGRMIVEKQENAKWGTNLIDQLAIDLKRGLPDTQGFSRSNLYNIRQFYLFYKDISIVQQVGGQLQSTEYQNNTIVQQVVGQLHKDSVLLNIPWGHHVVIIGKTKNLKEALFYINKTIENNWSRNVLELQIETDLFNRKGSAIDNFSKTLPSLQSDLAKETLKNPYVFDFLTLEENVQELEIEKQLVDNITKLLLELGKGFAFVGRQYVLQVGGKERRIDLLFYHTKLHCYVVIDLKTGEFEPEYAGKMNFYLSAVDDLLKSEIDNPSIGIILCKSKNAIDVEYSLRDLNKPMGISEFSFNELPANIKNSMPTIKEIESEFNKLR